MIGFGKQLSEISLAPLPSHNYRITDWLRLEGIPGGHLFQTPCSSGVTWGQLSRTMSRQPLNTSKVGNSTTSLDNLCQCLGSLTVIRRFLDIQIDNSFLTALMTTPLICFNVFSCLKHHILFSFLKQKIH